MSWVVSKVIALRRLLLFTDLTILSFSRGMLYVCSELLLVDIIVIHRLKFLFQLLFVTTLILKRSCFNFKGHRILALTEDIEAVIDRLVFCSTHPDEPIKFYCSQCDEAICNTCHVVKHKAHDIVTVDDALSKMIPQLTDQVKLIQERSCFIEKNIQKLDKNLDEVKKNFSTCRNSIDKEIEERIAKLRKQQKKLKQELTEEEEKQVLIQGW